MADESQTPAVDDAAEPKDPLPKNTVELEDAGTLKKKVTVTVARQRIDAKQNEMFGELAGSTQVPGFRIGRAPRRLIEKRFGKEVDQDVRNALIGEALGSAIEDAGLKTLGEPDLDLEKIELPDSGDLQFDFEVEIEPEFELPEIKGIEVTRIPFDVNEEKVDEYVDNLRERQARYETTDQPAQAGDAVVTAAKITGDDIAWENPRVPLRVAAGVVEGLPLVDLDKTLAEKNVGDVVTIPTQAAETHPNEAWQGKDVTVELTIHEVQRRVLPELNEEFATSRGFESLKGFRDFIAERLKARVDQEMQRSLREQVCSYLLEKTDFALPEGVVKRQTARALQRQYVDLLQSGIPREKIDENLARLQAAASEKAQQDLRLSFILGKIAEAKDVTVGDDEVNARIAEMARSYNRRPERLRQELAADGSIEQVNLAIRDEKTLDLLLGEAKIVEKAPEETPAETKKPAKKKTAKKKAEKSDKETSFAETDKKATKKTVKKTASKSDKKSSKSKS